MKKRLIRIVGGLLAAILLICAGFIYDVYSYPGRAVPVTADAAIVLGAAISDGQPSPVFCERLNHGIELLRSGQVRRLILTGGRASDEEMAEALAARNYVIELGVSADQILIETNSHTTYQNLYYANEVARDQNLHSFLVVTDPYHLRRAMRMTDRLHLNAHASSTPTSRLNQWKFLMQESGRNVKFLWRHTCHQNAHAEELAITEH
jgi:uncharacterized SAM-binding protein YcdF (DUF218 family)